MIVDLQKRQEANKTTLDELKRELEKKNAILERLLFVKKNFSIEQEAFFSSKRHFLIKRSDDGYGIWVDDFVLGVIERLCGLHKDFDSVLEAIDRDTPDEVGPLCREVLFKERFLIMERVFEDI